MMKVKSSWYEGAVSVHCADIENGNTEGIGSVDTVAWDVDKETAKKEFGGPVEDALLVTRVIVSKESRGKGMARHLVSELVKEADMNKKVLILEAMPYTEEGNISQDKLIEFFKGFGFIKSNTEPIMYRRPQ